MECILAVTETSWIALNINVGLVDRLQKKEQTRMYDASYILIFTEEKVADVYWSLQTNQQLLQNRGALVILTPLEWSTDVCWFVDKNADWVCNCCI